MPCILFHFSFSVYAKAALQNSNDSLLNLLSNKKETSQKVELLNQLSIAYWDLNEREVNDSVKILLAEAITLSCKLSYQSGFAEALYNLGRYHLTVNNTYA